MAALTDRNKYVYFGIFYVSIVIVMVKNIDILRKFELNLSKKGVNRRQNFRIADALYKEARSLGIFPLDNPLEGIEVDIKIAKVINRV